MSHARLWNSSLCLLLALPASLLLALPAAGEGSWLRPKVDYSAETVMRADGKKMTGRVWASGAKERRSITVGKRSHEAILRKDRGVTWVLMPEQRMYLEQGLDEGGLTQDR